MNIDEFIQEKSKNQHYTIIHHYEKKVRIDLQENKKIDSKNQNNSFIKIGNAVQKKFLK